MFLIDLNEGQQKAFLIIGIQFMHCDGKVTIEEQQLMELMRRETDMELPADAREMNMLDLLDVFDTTAAKVILLLELLHMGYVDGEFSEPENDFLLEIVDNLGFTEHKLTTYAHWVLGNIAWQQEATKFWKAKS